MRIPMILKTIGEAIEEFDKAYNQAVACVKGCEAVQREKMVTCYDEEWHGMPAKCNDKAIAYFANQLLFFALRSSKNEDERWEYATQNGGLRYPPRMKKLTEDCAQHYVDLTLKAFGKA